ncbi:31445_t:CDS:1, partial [Racocetra persica]
GRRKRNVVVYRLISQSDHKKKEKQKGRQTKNNNLQSNEDTTEQVGVKRQRRLTNSNEKKLLEDILRFDTFPEDKATEILKQLQDHDNDWDMQRVRIYWNNNRYSKRKKVSIDL